MSGHAILDSCHNCGKRDVPLFVVDQSETSQSCKEIPLHHHIHVIAACEWCRDNIWFIGRKHE